MSKGHEGSLVLVRDAKPDSGFIGSIRVGIGEAAGSKALVLWV